MRNLANLGYEVLCHLLPNSTLLQLENWEFDEATPHVRLIVSSVQTIVGFAASVRCSAWLGVSSAQGAVYDPRKTTARRGKVECPIRPRPQPALGSEKLRHEDVLARQPPLRETLFEVVA